MLILGIETSCDETAAAVVEDGRSVHSSVVRSQSRLHEPYRGVVPEIACRAHLADLLPTTEQALDEARCAFDDLDAVAVANVPGLIGGLLIGLTTAKTLSWLLERPLIGVNHIEAHVYAAALGCEDLPFPCVSLVVSGGHTSLFHSRSPLEHDLLGATTDDAAGEAFDKVAAILGLGYPGGPEIDRVAKRGNPSAVAFPRTLLRAPSLDFSFSGLKTAVLYHCRGQDARRSDVSLTDAQVADVAAAFQEAVVDVLVKRTRQAVEATGVRRIVMGGGVAANSRLRARMADTAPAIGAELVLPPISACLDNAAMVAGLAYHHWLHGECADLYLDACARTATSRAPQRKGRP